MHITAVILSSVLFIVPPFSKPPIAEVFKKEARPIKKIGWKTVFCEPIYLQKVDRWLIIFLRTGNKKDNEFGQYVYSKKKNRMDFIPFTNEELRNDLESALFIANIIPPFDIEEVLVIEMTIESEGGKRKVYYTSIHQDPVE